MEPGAEGAAAGRAWAEAAVARPLVSPQWWLPLARLRRGWRRPEVPQLQPVGLGSSS